MSEDIFLKYFSFPVFALLIPWQPIQRAVGQKYMVDTRIFKERFYKSFVTYICNFLVVNARFSTFLMENLCAIAANLKIQVS